MTGERDRLDFTVAKQKQFIGQNGRGWRSRHVGVVPVGPGGEKVPRLKAGLPLRMNVNRCPVKGFSKMGSPSRDWKTTRSQKNAVKPCSVEQPLDPLHLEGLVPRGPRIDENMTGLP